VTKVLLLSPIAAEGGSERALAALARKLPDVGFEPEAVLLGEGPLEGLLASAGCRYRVLAKHRLRQVPATLGTVARLRREVRAANAALVVGSQSKGHIYGGAAALAARVPAVWWQHAIPHGEPIERVAARIPAAVVVCGSAEAAAYQRRLTPRTAVRVVQPGLPLEQIALRRGSGSEIRKRLGWDSQMIVGTVARLQRGKGQDVFLQAAARLAARFPEARFLVVGGAIIGIEGSYEQELRALADSLGLGRRLRFAGHQADPYPWIDALDVVVHASSGEGFGLSVVEAMALGKPLVATNRGGPAEIVEHERSGLLVPEASADGLAEAVACVLDDRALAQRLADAAPKRAARFSDTAMAEDFAAVLCEVLGRRARRPAREPTKISVIVPTYRRPDQLVRCLSGLRAQRVAPSEIIVVRRGDDEESERALRAAGVGVRVVCVERPGVVAAMRAGAEASSGDVVAFVDDDVVPRDDWTERVLAHFRDPDVGAVGGRDVLHPPHPGERTTDVGRITRWGKLIGNHHLGVGGARDVDVLKGCNIAFRCETLALPRGFRGSGAEVHYEIAACLWARNQGWRVLYDADIVVDHFPAHRFDGYGRAPLPSDEAVRDVAYNLVAAVLSVEPGLRTRRALYGLLVGDAGTPGVVRALAAVLRRERRVAGAFLPSMRGQAAALRDALRGRTIALVPIGPAAAVPPGELEENGSADPVHAPPRS
jgi:glycosyltransferase involved in cell wall biosynthesis